MKKFFISLSSVPRRTITGRGSCMLIKKQTVFQSSVPFYIQHCVNDLVSLHPCQRLVLSVFFFF